MTHVIYYNKYIYIKYRCYKDVIIYWLQEWWKIYSIMYSASKIRLDVGEIN